MQFSTALFAAVLAATNAVAAPAPVNVDVSMMAAAPQWIIQDMKRDCNKADTECTWNFKVNTQLATATTCKYVVKGTKASQTRAAAAGTCGPYTITSGWSDQFGANNGFTTLSVVDQKKRLIVWPSYTDSEVKGGKVVSPNKSYAPASI
ncbi:hypothetical protein B0I35DRAFT_483682 [Stachybotrys elegans]|uniref:Small secreted protein n=1 Tax=Stachybotrys elegans TaxID=80388 RepID=A0A8K0SGU1_9HYPO|nr:hypothetical protein B0I35DRAFT_483682 [Stachybotrys elegans]